MFHLLSKDGQLYMNIIYLDHIITIVNQLDGIIVVALLEVVIARIIVDLLFINQAIITPYNII